MARVAKSMNHQIRGAAERFRSARLRSGFPPAPRIEAAMREWVILAVLTLGALPAGCGGGGGSPAGPAPNPATPSPSTLPGAARAFAGTRVIVVQGSPVPGAPGAGSYTVDEVEQDQLSGGGAPAGTTFDRHATRTFTGPAPAGGVYLQTQTIDAYVSAGPTGLALLGSTVVTVGRDIDAEQHSAPGTQFTDTRTIATVYPNVALVVPSTAANFASVFPLAFTAHLTEKSISSSGVVGITSKDTDSTRVATADGAFDETGRLNLAGVHAIHQLADGSGTSHDQVPGFSLYDVAVSAPQQTGGPATLAVTTQSQGRTVGNPPVVTASYTTPVWYSPGPTAGATISGTPNSHPPAACGSVASQTTFRVSVAQGRVDVTSGLQFVENDENYVDVAGNTLCRVTTDVYTRSDITTGAFLGQTTDTTAVRFTGNAAAGVTFGVKRSR
jgi:hypothetical protein